MAGELSRSLLRLLEMILDKDLMVTPEENAADSHGGICLFHAGRPEAGGLDELVRTLPGMRTVVQAIRDLAVVDVPVLVEGEAGTEIDFVAHEIHMLSPRRRHPFIVVACAGVSESSLANQFWGVERRASAELTEDSPSLFEQAEGGTVFFEETRDIPLNQQVQLARMIRTHEILLSGQTQPRRVDVRLICATKFNLVNEVAEGCFNSDLLYKIRVAHIRLPPLRERLTDIPPLLEFYLQQCRGLMPNRNLTSLSEEATGLLLEYSWPGNLMELQSAIESAALRCKDSTIMPGDLPEEILASRRGGMPSVSGAGHTEKDRLQAAMGAAKGNRTMAARMLGISRATLYRRLKCLGISTRQ